MSAPDSILISPPVAQLAHQGFQVLRVELVQSEVVGAGTSAVVLRGAEVDLPEGAVLVAPAGSSTSSNAA